jgi:hypothetical protein
VTYKNLSLSFLVDWQKGSQIFSLDQWYGRATGLYPETVFTNDLGNPVRAPLEEGGGTIQEGVNADGTPNDVRANGNTFALFGYATNPNRGFVYDASYIKLREVSLSYRLSNSTLENTFLNGVTLSVVGSNLWIMHKNLPYADPEAGQSSGNTQGWQSGTLPSVRQVAFSVKLDI